MSVYDRYDLDRLLAELRAAGIQAARLGLYIDPTTGVETWQIVDADDNAMTLTPAVRAVIAAHTPPLPPPVPDYGSDASTPDQIADGVAQLRAYLALPSPTQAQTVAAFKLTIRAVLFILRRSGL